MWDCHCHLADFDPEQLPERLEQARRSGIVGWLSCAYDVASWERQSCLGHLPGVMLAQGLHPWVEASDLDLQQLARKLQERSPRVVALGECGLDFYRAREAGARERQRVVLREQFRMAKQLQLPVVLHCVRAHQALLEEVRAAQPLKTMVHGFLGGWNEAQEWLRLGAYLSLGPHAISRQELMRRLPLDRILIESDAPSKGASLLDLHRVLAAWRQFQPLQEEHFEANLCRFLGIPQEELGRRMV